MAENPKILLVDDEPAIVKMVARRLQAEGYRVTLAFDGEEALARLKEQVPDLVILDVMLPKINGFEVCRKLRAAEDTKDLPVIMFTAMAQQKDKRQGYECGANAYICKPFRSYELVNKIQELIERRRQSKPDACV